METNALTNFSCRGLHLYNVAVADALPLKANDGFTVFSSICIDKPVCVCVCLCVCVCVMCLFMYTVVSVYIRQEQ